MSLILLRSPFLGYRGTTDFPHGDGVVVFPNGSRHFTRAYVSPAYTNTPLQALIRGFMTSISQSWQTVSDMDALDWATLANQMSPINDKDGRAYDISAQGAFTKVNMYRQLDANVITHTAPDYSHPAAPGINDVHWLPLPDEILTVTFRTPITFAGSCLLEISNRTYSTRRSARKNEIVIPYNTPSTSFDTVVPSDTAIQFYGSTFRFLVAGGERRGFRIVYLDANYVPGQIDLITLTIAT